MSDAVHDHSPTAADAAQCDARAGHCQLCGDDAVVGRVLDIDSRTGTATVAFENGPGTVALDLIAASVGDEVLVHLGFAIERVRRA